MNSAAIPSAGIGNLTAVEIRHGQSESGGKLRNSLIDAGLPSPDLECCGTGAAVTGCGHEMTSWAKVTVDHRVGRQKALRLTWRLEPLHLPLTSSGWTMRILSSIVQVPARPIADIGENSTLSDAVAAQAIGDKARGLYLSPCVRRLKKRLAAAPFRQSCTRMSSTTPC